MNEPNPEVRHHTRTPNHSPSQSHSHAPSNTLQPLKHSPTTTRSHTHTHKRLDHSLKHASTPAWDGHSPGNAAGGAGRRLAPVEALRLQRPDRLSIRGRACRSASPHNHPHLGSRTVWAAEPTSKITSRTCMAVGIRTHFWSLLTQDGRRDARQRWRAAHAKPATQPVHTSPCPLRALVHPARAGTHMHVRIFFFPPLMRTIILAAVGDNGSTRGIPAPAHERGTGTTPDHAPTPEAGRHAAAGLPRRPAVSPLPSEAAGLPQGKNQQRSGGRGKPGGSHV